jgi:hypothetical protein
MEDMGVQRWASLHMIAWACMILYGLSHFVSTKKKKKMKYKGVL